MTAKNKFAAKTGEKGFTMIELIVALAVFLVGVAAIYGVARIATIQRNTVNTRTDQLRSARIAIEYIRRDALNAGYGYHRTGGVVPDNIGNNLFGLGTDADADRDYLTAVMSGNERNSNSLNFGGKTDVVAFINRDTTFNGGLPADYTIKTPLTGGTAANLTIAATTLNNCKIYDLYLIESGGSLGVTQIIGMATSKPDADTLQFAPGDPLNVNQSMTATGHSQNLLALNTVKGTLKRLNLVSYSVTPAGVLIRKRFGNREDKGFSEQVETRELVYGVSDFQIKYFLENGTIVDDPSNGNNGRVNQQNMNGVVQIQVSITIANDPNDGQPRAGSPITITEYISTKNLRYEAS